MNAANDGDPVVLVDEDDNPLGTTGKLDAHQRGLKHRAISVLVRNRAGEFLLQQRALSKYHSAGLWTNACCSHPLPDETPFDAAHRRLMQEMGFDCALEPMFVVHYNEAVPGGLTENELVHVFGGTHDGPVAPDPGEVAAARWTTLEALAQDMDAHPERYTVWFRKYMSGNRSAIARWLSGGLQKSAIVE